MSIKNSIKKGLLLCLCLAGGCIMTACSNAKGEITYEDESQCFEENGNYNIEVVNDSEDNYKVIYYISYEFNIDNYDTLHKEIYNLVMDAGGYVQSINENFNYNYCNYIYRIPSSSFVNFATIVDNSDMASEKNFSSEKVTNSYKKLLNQKETLLERITFIENELNNNNELSNLDKNNLEEDLKDSKYTLAYVEKEMADIDYKVEYATIEITFNSNSYRNTSSTFTQAFLSIFGHYICFLINIGIIIALIYLLRYVIKQRKRRQQKMIMDAIDQYKRESDNTDTY